MEVEAELNHGRWIVKCPYCNGAELLDTGVRVQCRCCHHVDYVSADYLRSAPHSEIEHWIVSQELPGETFFCRSCKMAANKGESLPIKKMPPELKKQVERLMAGRPLANRNWVPGEPIEKLVAENKAHGIKED